MSGSRVLLVDNDDSYTFNLYHQLYRVTGAIPLVVRNDALSWQDALGLDVAAVVLSPGPGTPECDTDVGICRQLIEHATVPLLGVCLGHQGIGLAHGAQVVRAPEVVHGRTSRIRHTGTHLFTGLPQDFRAVRYHSLVLHPDLPDELEQLATTDDGTVMAVKVRGRDVYGVQFHPESIRTEHGDRLLASFTDLVRVGATVPTSVTVRAPEQARTPAVRLTHRRLPTWHEPEELVHHLRGSGETVWLDGAHGEGHSYVALPGGSLRRLRLDIDQVAADLEELALPHDASLPFPFQGGHVGWLGYEFGAPAAAPRGPQDPQDVAFVLVDRFVAYDHRSLEAHLVTVHPLHEDVAAWLETTARDLARLPQNSWEAVDLRSTATPVRDEHGYLDDIARCREQLFAGESYEICLTNRFDLDSTADPWDVHRQLRRDNPAPHAAFLELAGTAVCSSSPELFLEITPDGTVETRPVKGTAPRSADPVEDDGRRDALCASVKEQAENLMVLDLLRHDLGTVAEPDSVSVPALMQVRTYETVHQLVSTVRARRRPDVSAVDVVRACSPGGSMTGAPKQRTMQVIAEVEGRRRGVYSGTLGFLSCTGTASLSIVIRTAVLHGGRWSVGAGGAITVLSDPHEEWDEVRLKASTVLRTFGAARELAP